MMDVETEGKDILDDKEISAMKLSKREEVRKESISFVFQQFALVFCSDYSLYYL